MDYKYIEQLLERYSECQTTLEEETILRNFFAQADIPARLLPYASLFLAEEEMAQERLGDDFDERVLKVIDVEEEAHQTAHIVPLSGRRHLEVLRPLWRAAAVVAIVLTIGMAAQQGFEQKETTAPAYAEMTPADTAMLFIVTYHDCIHTVGTRTAVFRQTGLLHNTLLSRKHDIVVLAELSILQLADQQTSLDGITRLNLQYVLYCTSLRSLRTLGDIIYTQPITAATTCKEHHRVMHRTRVNMLDKVIVTRSGAL